MSTREDIDDRGALVAEFVLGLLSPREHERVSQLIEDNPRLRAEHDFWVSRFGALNSQFEDVPVPPRIYAALESRLFGSKAKSSFWDSLALWRSVAASALAVAVVAVGFNMMQPATDVAGLTTQLVAALELEGSDVKFVALYDGTGNVRLTALSGQDVPERDYELWAIQGGNAPVSMGVIPVDQRSSVSVTPDVLAGLGEGSVLAITLEPKGGSPSGAPTGPIVAQGAITQI